MCKMRETEPWKDPPLTLRPQTKWNISGEARTGGSLVLAPPHLKNFGFSFSALALAALALPLEKQTSAVPHSPAGLTRSFPLAKGRTVASGPLLEEALALGTWGAGVTCRSCRGSLSAAGRAELGSPWSIPDTWGRPHVSPPALFFTEGRFWRKSRGREEMVKTLHSGLARRLCEVTVPFMGHPHVPHQTGGQKDRQTDPRGLRRG